MAESIAERGGAGSWVLGGFVGVVGLLGLFLASRALDVTVYWVGILVFVFAVMFVYNLIISHTGGKGH